jgi:hypothetical protein
VSLFLQWLGWTVNEEKSHLEASRIFAYLGWEWNLLDLMVKLTETRRKKALLLQKARKQAHKLRIVPVRSLAKLIGVLNVARIQFPRASLFMMKLNKLKTRAVKRHVWDGFARMNPSVLCKLQTWTQWIKSNHPNSLKKPPLPQAIITTDAAPTGWGATLSSISSIQTQEDTIKRYGA